MVPLSPLNDTLVTVAEWVGDTGLLAVSRDEILYMVGCELTSSAPISLKIENECQTNNILSFVFFSIDIMLIPYFVPGCLLLALSLLTLQFI